MPITHRHWAAGALALAVVGLHASAEAQSGCQLQYPIVFSHHWSARKICPGLAPGEVTSETCEAREPEHYCVRWDAPDAPLSERNCVGGWEVPAEELELPPRVDNPYDARLVRDDMAKYHRYYGKGVVDRLRACGNAVYLSDKPIFASYAVRARALRNTVKQALAETGADKVILVGLSQGSQDARWMTAMLPFDDASDPSDPNREMMRDHVAAVVSTAGEPHGTESASLALDAIYACGTNPTTLAFDGWGVLENDPLLQSNDGGGEWCDSVVTNRLRQEEFDALFWRVRSASPTPVYDLIENAWIDAGTEDEVAMDLQQRYDSYLRSLAVLSRRFMRGASLLDWSWSSLTSYVGIPDRWSEAVPPALEQDNGVAYYSYAAKIQSWDDDDWGTGMEKAIFQAIETLWGDNEGHVTVEGQRFDTLGFDNFHHIKTLDGSPWGRGYHHMFFTGRNPIYGESNYWLQEWAPYKGDAADFYEQMARDLVARGL